MPRAAKKCRPMFDDILSKVVNRADFYLGVIVGYAEKLQIGAIDCFMLRPNESDYKLVIDILKLQLLEPYGLQFQEVAAREEEPKMEIWVASNKVKLKPAIKSWQNKVYQSPEWHLNRGLMLGIPKELIDEEYHLR